jgi:hypothetical protein
MNFKRFQLSALALFFIGTCSSLQAQIVQAGWNTSLSLGFNLSTFESDQTRTGVAFGAGILQKYYFHEHIGFFFGAEVMQRELKFDADLKDKVLWLDIPAGITFQYMSWGSGLGQLDLGGYYTLPWQRYEIGASRFDTNNAFGLYLNSSLAFPLDENFYFGFYLNYKYGFQELIEDPNGTKNAANDFGIGLNAKFLYD